MVRASACAVEILIDQLPLYPGAASLARRGIASSLQPQNIRIRHSIQESAGLASHAAYPLLFDPQTAGGLLAGVAQQQAEPCLQQLRELGYQHAQIIARVTEDSTSAQIIRLVNS